MLVYDIYLTLLFGSASFARWLSQGRPVPVPCDPEHDHRDGRQVTGHDDCGEA